MSFIINPYRFGVPATFNPATDQLPDSVVFNPGVAEFYYVGVGQTPGGGASTDSVGLDQSFAEFYYVGAGETPSGAVLDSNSLDAGIVNFSYTT